MTLVEKAHIICLITLYYCRV